MKENYRKTESGSAGVKLVIALVILILAGNAGYNYIPTAYNGANLKQEMQAAVMQGMSLPPSAGDPVEATKKKFKALLKFNDAPADSFVEVKQLNGAIQGRIAYTKQVSIIPFGIYDYSYQFDHIASANSFLSKQ